ncbi:hypothetical protein K435DRAFT_785661, partial [Dendrothele bispora CBS 962.96]
MVQLTKDDYNRVLRVLPSEVHPGLHNMDRIPGRQSIITIIASIYIIHLEREIRLLRDSNASTEDLDREIAELERQKEESMSGSRSLSRSEKVVEDQQRFQKLESLMPRDGKYILCGQLWTLISAGEYIQTLHALIQDLKFSNTHCCGIGNLEACNRPYCLNRDVKPALETYDILDLDYRPFNRTAVDLLPEPLWYGFWSADGPTEEDVAPYIAHIAPPTREANFMVRKWVLKNHIDAQLAYEREEALQQDRDPGIPVPGSLTSAAQILSRYHEGDNSIALVSHSLDYLAAMAVMQQFTERVFAERGPLDWVSKWHPPRV